VVGNKSFIGKVCEGKIHVSANASMSMNVSVEGREKRDRVG